MKCLTQKQEVISPNTFQLLQKLFHKNLLHVY